MRDLLQRLGLAAYGGNYESIRRRLARLGALDQRYTPQPRRLHVLRALPAEDLERLVAHARSLSAVLRELGMTPSASALRELRSRIARDGLDVSHHHARTSVSRPYRPRIPLELLCVVGGTTGSHHLKQRLLREGVLPHRCDVCGTSEWLTWPVPRELDHINGDRRDNRLENLRLLCPNCHALTPTYRGRNIGRIDVLTSH